MNGIKKAKRDYYRTLDTKELEQRLDSEYRRSGYTAATTFSLIAEELRRRGSTKPSFYF